MSLTLSDDDLFDVTNRKRTDARAKVLEALMIPFQRRPDGSLLVYRAHLPLPKEARQKDAVEPDWSGLHAARKKS